MRAFVDQTEAHMRLVALHHSQRRVAESSRIHLPPELPTGAAVHARLDPAICSTAAKRVAEEQHPSSLDRGALTDSTLQERIRL
jgi:hypothetical protein